MPYAVRLAALVVAWFFCMLSVNGFVRAGSDARGWFLLLVVAACGCFLAASAWLVGTLGPTEKTGKSDLRGVRRPPRKNG